MLHVQINILDNKLNTHKKGERLYYTTFLKAICVFSLHHVAIKIKSHQPMGIKQKFAAFAASLPRSFWYSFCLCIALPNFSLQINITYTKKHPSVGWL